MPRPRGTLVLWVAQLGLSLIAAVAGFVADLPGAVVTVADPLDLARPCPRRVFCGRA